MKTGDLDEKMQISKYGGQFALRASPDYEPLISLTTFTNFAPIIQCSIFSSILTVSRTLQRWTLI